jgi:error-prone DNA polymerase
MAFLHEEKEKHMMQYTELQVTTNFSFLKGGSHPEEMVEQAALLGYSAIAITDHNTLAGVVRAHMAAKKQKNLRILPGCCLNLLDGPSLLAYPTSKQGYARLSALLTEGNLRTEKGQCVLYRSDVYRYAEDIKFIVVPPFALDISFSFPQQFIEAAKEYRRILGTAVYLGATCTYQGDDDKKLFRLAQLSEALQLPLVATNDVYYHHYERRELQDVLTCIREKCSIQDAGFRLCQNAERYLKPAGEMLRLFRKYPEAIERSAEIAAACQFSLDSLQYIYPEEICPQGRTPQEELVRLTWEGARRHFNDQIPPKICRSLNEELAFIERKNYASYFLTVYDFVKYARDNDILCQGRGSAANSVVCYCLGITSVDPSRFNLLFARFMSDARDEPPDIDVDFEHERREEVMQYIFNKYGRHRAAIVATVTRVHHKGAIRDVGKAMGLSQDAINRLSKSMWELNEEWYTTQKTSSEGFSAADPQLRKIWTLTEQYVGFPRQLGQHTGGFVITQDKLSDLCPILNARMENRTCIEWNKDDIDDLKFMKVDVLALGMLTCIRKAFDLLEVHYGKSYTLANIPQDVPEVYDMICNADTLGVFQIESRAQMSMLPRLQPREFYDLVIEVAIVRPGPIQGDMVHPYLRRRQGLDTVNYPSDELKAILGRTLGVPLFQEQAMEIAIVAAGFTPAEADGLRRSMATFKAKGKVSEYKTKLIQGMIANGYKEEFAQQVFRQLEGFGSYGFPESHAASFALLVYVSAYIKCFYPDIFAAALLNSMPMGFYQPAQIVRDAQKHRVMIRPVDVNFSEWDNKLEEKAGEYFAIRLGFRQVKGLRASEMDLLVAARLQPYTCVQDLWRAGISIASLEMLADADAFRSMKLDRRQALWEIAALNELPRGLFNNAGSTDTDTQVSLPQMSLHEHVLYDYSTTTLSLKAHPVSFARRRLFDMCVLAAKELDLHPNGTLVRISGLVLVRQRPGTASGICFITIEDETGTANLVVFRQVFTQFRKEILHARLLMVEGRLQKEGKVIHVVVQRCYNLSALLQVNDSMEEEEKAGEEDIQGNINTEAGTTVAKRNKILQASIFPEGRNFK